MASESNPQPRAFPSNAIDPRFGGMTLADYFAAAALTGLITSAEGRTADKPLVAWLAWTFSDMMMREREARQEQKPEVAPDQLDARELLAEAAIEIRKAIDHHDPGAESDLIARIEACLQPADA